MDVHELIEVYFKLGLQYRDIVSVLAFRHRYVITERHLKRILRSRRLFRRKDYSSVEDAIAFIQHQLQTSGQLHGYRWMHAKCNENGLHIRKEHVRLILSLLDPAGVEFRKARRLHRRNYFAKGPNYIWHFDSYDKLKPYGICINGCIDGFSRKIIWLNAFTTSSDPKVIGGYYVETVESSGGCPRIIRGDCGTENGHVRDFQRLLRRNILQDSNIDSYIEGASTANQRIESWWGFLRKECMEFFISLFTDLKDRGLFDGGFLDKNLIRFCFLGIIQVSFVLKVNDVVHTAQHKLAIKHCFGTHSPKVSRILVIIHNIAHLFVLFSSFYWINVINNSSKNKIKYHISPKTQHNLISK